MAIRINFPYRTESVGFSFIADDIKYSRALSLEAIGLIITAYDVTEAVTLTKRITGNGIGWVITASDDVGTTCIRAWNLGDLDPLTLGDVDPLTIDDMRDIY